MLDLALRACCHIKDVDGGIEYISKLCFTQCCRFAKYFVDNVENSIEKNDKADSCMHNYATTEEEWDFDVHDLSFESDLSENSESDSDPDSNEPEEYHLKGVLADWTTLFGVRLTVVTALLKILQNFGHPELPSDARTLLSTSRFYARKWPNVSSNRSK